MYKLKDSKVRGRAGIMGSGYSMGLEWTRASEATTSSKGLTLKKKDKPSLIYIIIDVPDYVKPGS
jgi:hypothetical protein